MLNFLGELAKYPNSLSVDELSGGISGGEIQGIVDEKARNLLGLIEFQRGELGEAMKHWSISEYLNPRQNQATAYLKEIKKKQELLTNMSESLHLYNEAMELARKGNVNFAITRLRKAVHLNPQYVKAQLVLALCYMEQHHFKTALSVLETVLKLEALNPDAKRYRAYIAKQLEHGIEDESVSEIQDLSQEFLAQQTLTQADTEEIFEVKSRKRWLWFTRSESLKQLALFFAGVLCCAGFMWYLVYPDQMNQMEDQIMELELSENQLRAEKEELQQQLEGMEP
ncbi:MAG: tetratricopeptide repeat protein [Clostridia bacterium]|nr:tetratricopeptide repeat protein [Clostridia bacterium]